MAAIHNPFIVGGYISPHYFCEREKETEQLIRNITNGRNVVIISTRRMGKTGLIRHCFYQNEIKKNLVSQEQNQYEISDKLLGVWLQKNY